MMAAHAGPSQEWPDVTWLGAALFVTLSLVGGLIFSVVGYLSYNGMSASSAFYWTLIPALAVNICGMEFAGQFSIVRRAGAKIGAPLTFAHALSLVSDHRGFSLLSFGVLYLSAAAVFVLKLDALAILLFVSAWSATLLGWLCHMRRISAAPLPFWVIYDGCIKPLARLSAQRRPVASNMLLGMAVYLSVMTILTLGYPLVDSVLNMGPVPIILALLIHPLATPFIWVATGSDPALGPLLLVVSIAIQLKPMLSLKRSFHHPLPMEFDEVVVNSDEGPASEESFPSIAFAREIQPPASRESGVSWTSEDLDTHWNQSRYPSSDRKPGAESGLLKTYGNWSIGFTPGASVWTRVVHGMLLPYAFFTFILLAGGIFLPILSGRVAGLTGGLVICFLMVIAFYILNQFSIAEKVAMKFCGQGFPMRLSAIDVWLREVLWIPGLVVDLLATAVIVVASGYSVATGVGFLLLLRLAREVLHLHVLHNTWVRAHMPKSAPTWLQVVCLVYLFFQFLWLTILAIILSDIGDARGDFSVGLGLTIWIGGILAPMLGHWLLIYSALHHLVGRSMDRVVV